MKALVVTLTALIVAGSSAGQTAHSKEKTAPKLRPGPSAFTCPEPEAFKACKSYEELLKAKDSGLPDSGYVCFRQDADEFFVVAFSTPPAPKRWDDVLKQTVIDKTATIEGSGYVDTYRNGIEDSDVMPYLYFSGKWRWGMDTGLFSSDKINSKETHPPVVQINENQVMIDKYKYKSRAGGIVRYNLTIQRSTGRFSESFLDEVKQVPFMERTGRCIRLDEGR